MASSNLSTREQAMVATWEAHVAAEFRAKDIDATMATMTAEPFVNHAPVMTGGVGARAVRAFYSTYFIGHHPPDMQTVTVARTVGADRLVEELIYKCTHTIEMPWLLPGIAPTGRRLEFFTVVVCQFQGDKVAGETIYWDQASVLAQAGLLDAATLPIVGIEAARKVANPASQPSNQLIDRARR